MVSRSDSLRAWIESFPTKEEIKKNLRNLPDALKKELLQEALQDDRVRREYEDSIKPSSLKKGVQELLILEEYCQYEEILGAVEMRLPRWDKNNDAPSSNLIDSSALFQVNKKVATRKYYEDETIYSRSTTNIVYSGYELNQDDWDFFSCLLRISADSFNTYHEVRASEILSMLSLPKTGYYYDRLYESLRRIYKASLFITNTPKTIKSTPQSKSMLIEFGKGQGETSKESKSTKSSKISTAGMRLIDQLYLERDMNRSTEDKIVFVLDSRLIRLFGNNEYGLVNWKQRLELGQNSLAKKLQCYFSGQGQPERVHKIQTLFMLSGMECEIKKFIFKLKIALDELKQVGVISDYQFLKDKKGDSKDRKVLIKKS